MPAASRIAYANQENQWRPVRADQIEKHIEKPWPLIGGQLSSSIVVPTSQRGLLFRVIPDTQMRVLLDLNLLA
jgi:hypothetical protein